MSKSKNLSYYIMAELHLYKCKDCGWEIEATPDGGGFLMFGGLAYFLCKECKHVYEHTFELGHEDEINTKCPECGSTNTTNWKPTDKCPKCGGDLENQGLSCLMD